MRGVFAVFFTGLAWQIAAGQTPDQIAKPIHLPYLIRNPNFWIPVNFAPESTKHITLAKVFVSRDQGKTWQLVEAVSPRNGGLKFFAPEDGWYWFTLQSIQKDGSRMPRRTSAFEADLKVLVDREGKLDSVAEVVTSNKMAYGDLEQQVRDLRQLIERLEKRIGEMEKRLPEK